MNKTHYFLLLKRISLVVLIYTLCRVVFCLINWGNYAGVTFFELGTAFLRGFLFDLAAVLLINAVVMVLSTLPFPFVSRHPYQARLSIFYQCLNIPFLILNIINAGYFRLSGKQITPTQGPEIEVTAPAQVWALASEYWYVSLLALMVSLFLVWYHPTHFRLKSGRTISPAWAGLSAFLLVAVSVLFFALMVRTNPLPPGQQRATRATHLENLARNAAFNLLSRLYDRSVARLDRKKVAESE
ncbi:MAG: hypothetical protein H7Z75_06505 [Ferruginibacter sp.]|nr:hypothetical protein [Cytophagales bacterium]